MEMTSSRFGSKATYNCDRGKKLVGVVTRTCLANKTWSGEEPQCTSGMLHDPTVISHCSWLAYDYNYHCVNLSCNPIYLFTNHNCFQGTAFVCIQFVCIIILRYT